jgi:hypothetical protein
VDFAPNVTVGQTLSAPKAATECIASFVFHAETEESSREKIVACRTWFYDSIGISQCA